jgi:hypothetical protein
MTPQPLQKRHPLDSWEEAMSQMPEPEPYRIDWLRVWTRTLVFAVGLSAWALLVLALSWVVRQP